MNNQLSTNNYQKGRTLFFLAVSLVVIAAGLIIGSFNVSVAGSVLENYSVYRFWSDAKQSHFYTISQEERDGVIENYDDHIWKYEGIAWYAYEGKQPNTFPIYRFWSDQKQKHFYTISEIEKNWVIENYDDYVWKYEGIAYYAYKNETTGTGPVYRFWSDQKQGHFYTASKLEKEYVESAFSDYVWKCEGIAWYVKDLIARNCQSDTYNCSNFIYQTEAQEVYDYCKNEVGSDIHKLDLDSDGIACESLL